MPIYMDRHDLPGVTAKDVAEAHQRDLKIQENYGVKFLTYWFDPMSGTACCLADAPTKDAVKELHENSHGLIPHQIIEVDGGTVNAFLGRTENPKIVKAEKQSNYQIIEDPAFRIIMVTRLIDSALLISKYGEEKTSKLLHIHNSLVQKAVNNYEDYLAKKTIDGFIFSFTSAEKSILSASEIMKNFNLYNKTNNEEQMSVVIGLSAGFAVTEDSSFFGQTIRLAKRLCYVASKNEVIISSNVADLCKDAGLNSSAFGSGIKSLIPIDEQFLTRLMETTEDNWKKTEFDLEIFSKQTGFSRSKLYRKTTSLTGYSPNDFIKEFRLKKALELMERQKGNISEVALETGFSNPSYFSKCFHKRFGILPSSYARTSD